MELAMIGTRLKPTRSDTRRSTRRPLVVHGRISWKDRRGTTRIANIVTRNTTDDAVYVDWGEPSVIPLYRLVHFQVSPEARREANLPEPLRTGKVLSAVFRVGQRRRATGTPEGYALRLLVDPCPKALDPTGEETELVCATAIA